MPTCSVLPKHLLTGKWTPPLGTVCLAQAPTLLQSLTPKSLTGCKPSPLIVWWWCGWAGVFFIFRSVLPAHPHYPSTADNSSSRVAAAAIFIYSAFALCECCIVHSPLLTVLFSAEQQGSINERPLTIRSQLWLSEHSTVCSFNTQPHLPDNCVIRVCINNWSPDRDIYYAPVSSFAKLRQHSC